MHSFFMKLTVGFVLMSSTQANSNNGPGASTAKSSAAHVPQLTSKDLAGNVVQLPQGFPAKRSILLVAFQREQQGDIDTWVEGLKLGNGELPWLELPVIDNPGAIGRWFIDGGMRRGIKDHQVWLHVVTLYTKKADFKTAMQITSESSIHVFVADRSGEILQREVGRYSEDAGRRIRAAMNDSH
jgi:hypothetical protein